MVVQRVAQKKRARLRILNSVEIDQDMTVINFFTFIEWRKSIEQNKNSGEITNEVEVRQQTERKHSTF